LGNNLLDSTSEQADYSSSEAPFDPFGARRWTAVIHCFFDDSGKESDQGNPYVCIAGYMAIHDAWWTHLANGWGNQLFRHGISWLHMKDFMQNQSEYAALNWDWPKKKSILEEFIAIIKASQLIGFGVAVDAVAWRQFPKELTKAEGTAQEFCFMRIIRMIVERFKIARPDDWAVLYYDCDQGFTPARFQRFIRLRQHDPEVAKYFRGFSIVDPKSFLPLQAADLLAWQTRKDLMRKLGGHDSREEYKLFFESTLPFDSTDYVSEFWTASELDTRIVKPWLAAQQAGKPWDAKERKSCPECGHEFQGNGWDGIDAHWRAQHENVMGYEEAWPLIQSGQYKRKGE
jgi:hypothetical protein